MFAGTKRLIVGAGAAVLLLAANAAPANAIAFNIDWTGASGYTMTGMFSYSDALIDTGPIDETQIDSLMIEVFLNAASQGTWDMGTDGVFGTLNFNFDTTTEMFLVGGLSSGPMGQEWNTAAGPPVSCPNPGVGFASGSVSQGVCVNNGGFVGDIPVGQSTLTATRKVPVPEPATLALFGLGLAGLGFARRKRAA